MFSLTDGQHRAGRLADHFLGDGTEQHVSHRSAAMRSHDDQIYVLFPRDTYNLDEWCADFDQHTSPRDSLFRELPLTFALGMLDL